MFLRSRPPAPPPQKVEPVAAQPAPAAPPASEPAPPPKAPAAPTEVRAQGGLPPLYVELQAVGNVPLGVMQAALVDMRTKGISLADALLGRGAIKQADYIEAMHKAGAKVLVDRRDKLPKWDAIIGDAQGEGVDLALAIADTSDPRKRCFIIEAPGVTQPTSMAVMGAVFKRGYRVAGIIQSPPEFVAVIAAHNQQFAAATASEDEAKLHQDFDMHAQRALELDASDIHITCRGGGGTVCFRIDGNLEHYQDWTEQYTIAFVSALYNTMTERGSTHTGFSPTQRLDGAIERKFPAGLVRFRFASAPIAPGGFTVVLRLIPLGVKKRHTSMGELGYSKDQQEDLERMFACSSGLIFFLGTTGSGKSTSMAVALEGVARAKPGKKIRTVEQPVEYGIEGVEQTSVARDEFIPMISQMMRLDPDYLMVGETRDTETAAAVLQGARSGHLCVSTLHADGALLSYDRLAGLGIPRQELASVGLVAGLVYQRLVPVLCPTCKIAANLWASQHPEDAVLDRARRVNGGSLAGLCVENPDGCPNCRHKGVRGRTVCAEILRPTVDMMAPIASADSHGLLLAWRRQINRSEEGVMRGRTAFEHAIWKMRQGIVSPRSVESEFRFLDEALELERGVHAA